MDCSLCGCCWWHICSEWHSECWKYWTTNFWSGGKKQSVIQSCKLQLTVTIINYFQTNFMELSSEWFSWHDLSHSSVTLTSLIWKKCWPLSKYSQKMFSHCKSHNTVEQFQQIFNFITLLKAEGNCRKAATSSSTWSVCAMCACSKYNYNSKLVLNNIICFNISPSPRIIPSFISPPPPPPSTSTTLHQFSHPLKTLARGEKQKAKKLIVFHWAQTVLIVVEDCNKNTPNELNEIMETISQWRTAPNSMKYAYSRPIIEIITKYEDLIKLSSMKKRFADAAIPVTAIFHHFPWSAWSYLDSESADVDQVLVCQAP